MFGAFQLPFRHVVLHTRHLSLRVYLFNTALTSWTTQKTLHILLLSNDSEDIEVSFELVFLFVVSALDLLGSGVFGFVQADIRSNISVCEFYY